MSPEETHGPGAGPRPGESPGAPSEEELRAAYEAELSRITVIDMISQAAVSLLNLSARRLAPRGGGEQGAGAGEAATGAGGPAGAQDLEQVRDGIDGVRALLAILERRIPQEVRPLRDALSQLQMAYAAEVRSAEAPPASPPEGAPAGQGEPAGTQEPEQAEPQPGPGPAQASGRLWVPGS